MRVIFIDDSEMVVHSVQPHPIYEDNLICFIQKEIYNGVEVKQFNANIKEVKQIVGTD